MLASRAHLGTGNPSQLILESARKHEQHPGLFRLAVRKSAENSRRRDVHIRRLDFPPNGLGRLRAAICHIRVQTQLHRTEHEFFAGVDPLHPKQSDTRNVLHEKRAESRAGLLRWLCGETAENLGLQDQDGQLRHNQEQYGENRRDVSGKGWAQRGRRYLFG